MAQVSLTLCVNTEERSHGPTLEAPWSLSVFCFVTCLRRGWRYTEAEWRDETPPSLGSSGVSLLLLLLQDVDLSPHSFFFLDDKQVIHVQGRGPIPAFTDGKTVKKPIPVNTKPAEQTKPPYGKSK